MSELYYITLSEVLHRKGGGRSTLYTEINNGLFPTPVKLGKRRIGWPSHEVESVMQFFLRGGNQSKLKTLVKSLEESRKSAGGSRYEIS